MIPSRLRLLVPSALALALFACSGSNLAGLGKKKDSSSSDITAGTTSNQATVMNKDGSLPASGALSIAEGDTVANDAVGANLGLPPGITAAGKSVNVSDGNDETPSGGLQIMMPLDNQTSLALADGRATLVVMYKVKDATDDTKAKYGVVPKAKLAVTDTDVQCDLKGYGNYQPALLTKIIADEVEAPSDTPVLTKAQAQDLPSGVWGHALSAAGPTVHSIEFSAELTDFTASKCYLIVDTDRMTPWDAVTEVGDTPDYVFTPTASGTYYGRFLCESKTGVFSNMSGWTNGATVNL